MTPAAAKLEWREEDGQLGPVLVKDGQESKPVWAPQPGSQMSFLTCPVFECLYEGTRGPGKTDALLMSYAQHVGKGWGADWKGVVFRRTYPELKDIIDKSRKWFPRIFPGARYNRSEHFWEWPEGEQLVFAHFRVRSDYDSYHGHAYPFQGWEELCSWPDDECYTSMFSCARSTRKGMPIMVRATVNPYGVGHNWIKDRFKLPIPMGRRVSTPITGELDEYGEELPPRCAVHGFLEENKILLHADPNYISRIRAAARNPQELRAWLYGDWDIIAGGMFDDVWSPGHHVLPNVPLNLIPSEWRINRSYDHGQSAPFSVGWWAESNGEPLEYQGVLYGSVPGDTIRIAEWYGWNGKPNKGVKMLSVDIARGIKEREEDWGLKGRVKSGPADSSIFDDYEPGKSVAGDMSRIGVRWLKADKGPGSRKQGWQQMRTYLTNSKEAYREQPGMFVLERCSQFIRTVPVLPRCDKDPDDVNTEAEDHIGDEVRYRLRRRSQTTKTGTF